MTAGPSPISTVLDELVQALDRASAYNAQDQVAPDAVLWTDKERQWEAVIQWLGEARPGLLALGPYAPEVRSGPAIWLRCMLERALPEADWPEETVPVLYLPGVSRRDLRAVAECPRELQPLAEVQYRGVWFTQENTRDWSLFEFLTSKRGGLGLEVAGDEATRAALQHALTKLLETSVAEVRGRRLQAADFQALLQPDLVKQLLRWLDEPHSTRSVWSAEEWHSLRGACRERYGFDPENDGDLVGAEKLGTQEGRWGTVWARFAEAPAAYPNLPDLLRRAKPAHEEKPLFFHAECWPQCNEDAEAALREQITALSSLGPEAARAKILDLERTHARRRTWVWAGLGRARLAQALEHLAFLARTTSKKIRGADAAALVTSYVDEGWQSDKAALDALAVVSSAADVAAVHAASQAIYKPWLEEAAERFQYLVREKSQEGCGAWPNELAKVAVGTCILFADGLRLDLGKRLRTSLEKDGYLVEESWRFVPIPPVTPTAKPVASPVADLVTGDGAGGEQFQPTVRASGKPLTIERFRKLLGHRGFQDLRREDRGDPSGRAWTEYGEIDQRGHKEGWKLARRIAEEIDGLADRIRNLLDEGWHQIQVVTDHGWLLLPGGLPKVDMPHYLVESRWTRCATLKPGAQTDLLTAPWHWNPDVVVVLAPGIGTFRAGIEYSHGSLTLQECVVPRLVVRSAQPAGPAPTVDVVRWTGLRCRVHVQGAGAGWSVDLRTKPADASTSIAKDGQPKPIDSAGKVALVVDDPDQESLAAAVVLLDPEGRVASKRNTSVGGDE